MDALRNPLADRPEVHLAVELSAELDHLEAEVYRTLSIRETADQIASTARLEGIDEVRLRAELLSSDATSRAGAAATELTVQRELLDQAATAGYSSLVRRASTYLASSCDRLGMREEAMAYAYAGLPEHDGAAGDDGLLLTPVGDAGAPSQDEPRGWLAEAMMVVVLVTVSRPGADVTLMDQVVESVRRDCRPAVVAATEANFAEIAADIGHLDIAVRFAADAEATLRRHEDAEAVLTWESIAMARLANDDLPRAEAALQRALEIEPVLGVCDGNGDPWLTFAELCLRNRRPEDGLEVLDAPRRPTPSAKWVMSRDLKVRAELHAAMGDWQTAYERLQDHLLVYQQIRSIEGDRAVLTLESRVSVDVARQRASEFQQQALTDSLTGLANRRAVEQWLDRTAAQEQLLAVTVAIVDVDHFKWVNDRYSHEIGDRVLERLAACLVDTADHALGGPGLVGRLGGEEFILVWPSASAEAGNQGAERIRAQVGALTMDDLTPGLSLTVSIGTAFVDDAAQLVGLPRPALQRADAALYLAKDAGRNAIRAG